MFVEFLLCRFRVFAAADLMRGAVNARVAEVDPDPRPGTQIKIFGQQRNLRIFFFQIFVDDGGFVNDRLSIDENRNLCVRIEPEKIWRFVFEINFDELVGEIFLCQDNPSPVRIGSSKARVEFHGHCSLQAIIL